MSNTAGVAKPPPPAVGDDPGVADLVKQKLDERIKKNPKAGMVMGVSLGETATKPKSAPIAPMSLALNTPKTIDKSSGEMSRMSEDLSVDGTEPNITNSTSGSKRSGDVIIETPSVDTEAAKNKLLLDEKKASNKRCLLKLYVNCECQRQMHRLAEMYYGSRDNWYHFIPLTILTLISGIFAFGSTSDFFEGKTKEVFSLIVGICSILSGAVQSCSKNHNYAEKSKAHKTVALGMKKLGDEVTFDRIDPKSGLSAKGNTKKNKAADEEQGLGSNDEREAATMAEKVQGYRMVFNQVMESCDSIIPSHIAEGFALIDARMAIMLNSEQTHDRVENTLLLEEANARSIILANTYAELYTVYSTKTCWPWHYPNPDLAVSKAIRNVERTYGKSLHLFGNSFTTNEESPLLDCCTP